MAKSSSGSGTPADYLSGSYEFTPTEVNQGNTYFNEGSLTKLEQNYGSGEYDFNTNTFIVDPSLSPNLGGAQPSVQNPNASFGESQPVGGAPATASAKSIADIKTQLLRPATTSHYICRFQPPPDVEAFESQKESSGYAGASYKNRINQELIEILCCDASLPGATIATHDANNDFHGVTHKNAYRRLYDDRVDFTFYVDRNYTTLRFFEGWMAYIVNERVNAGQGLPSFEDKRLFYRVNYPKSYKCNEIFITKFEKDAGRKDAGPTLKYRFFDAFPISISSMPISYEASQVLKCTVSFSFSRYLISYELPSSPSKSSTSQQAQNAPGVPELQTTQNLPTVDNQLTEIKNMQEASRLRQAGYDAMSGGPTGVTVNGLPLYQ